MIFAVVGFPRPVRAQVEPGAGNWKTWVIAVADFRVPPVPVDSTQELDQVRNWTAQRNVSNMTRIVFWDAGPPAYRWIQVAQNEVARHSLAAPLATRAMA